ncbi:MULTISPECIES: hypothetical protein [Butyricimonas]|jgi:hypothetical protein|uniref:Uncharacterized protein n=1 Tax=Butyricimonas faecihominis TaxID=1472416 RepID=A0A7W6MYV4_9BACT|nr:MULTISPECIES: hypothetical protein [Butyricimonas]KAB1508072.1 hypothetical protein F8R21_05010 [Butyricimonas faecihominis]MBB4026462.1 hypothetical protein [Butyricimonas faecihominis]WOF09158.1 hypothetical protein F1611_12580 [Butyricimonas faecihominis]BEI58581.1 hypothetical protein Bfae18676_35560 [Butyricimonas faecihominis]GGJ30949.1 hypothetical protein GCM10007041_20230 [Butyricimonas faecihominis]
MKLIPKLQNGNTFQRDNTRVSTPPKPLLKKKEVREIPQRATISSKPQQSEYFDKQARINAIKREAYENMEKGKYNNFWTQPYTNFSGKDAYALASNLIKESAYAGAGEALGTLLAGLKLFKRTPKKYNIAESVKLDPNTTVGAQNIALMEAQNSYTSTMFPGGRMHPDMVNRAKALGWNNPKMPREGKTGLVNKNNFNDFFGGRFSNSKKRDMFKRKVVGTTDSKGNVMISRTDPTSGITLSPQDVKDTAWHEFLHRIQFKNKWTLDKKVKGGYYKADTNNKVAEMLEPYLGDGWAGSADEVWADTHTFRMKKGIGARDLTDSEATEAMMELMPHWNPTKFTPKAFIDIPKAIKALPSVLGATLMIPRNEN